LVQRNEDGIALATAILKQRFGEHCQTGMAIREQHGHTTTWIRNQPPDAVVFAHAAEDVVDVVRVCAEHRVPLIAFGTGTSLEGHVNAPAGGISIDLRAMNRVLAVHDEDLDCVIEPGVTRKELNEHLRDRGLFFPIDPGADASLGGMREDDGVRRLVADPGGRVAVLLADRHAGLAALAEALLQDRGRQRDAVLVPLNQREGFSPHTLTSLGSSFQA
jgi:D-lactate dehydrogenase (cytochrome)